MANDDVTRGGSNILRHQQAHGGDVAPTDEAAALAVDALIERNLGKADNVFHELVSETVHLDVHFVRPDGPDDAWTLYTTGMSDRPMTIPDGADVPRFAELMLRLPADWPIDDQDAFKEERWFWPVRWLKQLARLPHTYRTWLGDGHTIPNGDPARPVADGCGFVGFVIGHAASLAEDDDVARTPDGKAIQLYAVYPLHADELTFKLERGWGELADRLDQAGVSDVIEPGRPSVAGKKPKRR